MKDKEIQELLAASDSAIKLLKQKISELEAETGALTNESSNLTLECILKDKWIADLEAKYNELQDQADQYKSDLKNAGYKYQSLSDAHTMKVSELRVENDKLKNYIINQLLNN